MPISISPTGLTPPHKFPYRFGTIDLFQSKRKLDIHAWAPVAADGGVVAGPLVLCQPAATEFGNDCPPASVIKSTPIHGVRDPYGANPRWFEVALFESSLDCPDLKPAALRALEGTIEEAIENEVLNQLLIQATVLPSETGYQCALSAAVQAASDFPNSDGIALITIPPALAAYALGTHFLTIVGGRLEDAFGNVYRVLRGSNNNILFIEDQASYELWLSEPIIDELSEPRDSTRDTNTIIIRAERGYILLQDRCSAQQISFTCS